MIGESKTDDNRYGLELILDLHGCDTSKFNRESITKYFEQLCDLIDMQREDLHFWDDVGVREEDKQTSPHTQGTSAGPLRRHPRVTTYLGERENTRGRARSLQ